MAMGDWKDLEVIPIYIRRAGLDIKGATDALPRIKSEEAIGTVVSLFNR
jgi:hypothetical protein